MEIFKKRTEDIAWPLTTWLWAAALLPLLMVLSSFIVGTWSWGLMDDPRILATPGGLGERLWTWFKPLLDGGMCRPTFAFHTAVFYKLFEHNPVGFYIFRWVEVVGALAVWGVFAALVTGRKLALPLLIVVALSFFKLYDAFFYLSTQEILGVFFSGCAGISFYYAFKPMLSRQGALAVEPMVLGTIFLALTFGAKEPFVIVGLAWGLVLVIAGFQKPQRRSLLVSGAVFLVVALAYGLFLKIFVAKGYTGGYSFLDTGKIVENIGAWALHDLLAHLPWLVVVAGVVALKFKEGRIQWLWFCFGVALYFGYVLLLLPWNTTGHYSTPLAVFFAFVVTVVIVEKLEKVAASIFMFIAAGALVLNMIVGGAALQAASTYQQDTASLVKWLANNMHFEYEVNNNGAVVRSNAMEPGSTIPQLVKMFYGKSYATFEFTPVVRDIVVDPRTRYYLYGPNWGNQDLSRLGGKVWYPVFVSKNWILFRKAI